MTHVDQTSSPVTTEDVFKADGSAIEMTTVATVQMRQNVHHQNVIQSSSFSAPKNTASQQSGVAMENWTAPMGQTKE